MLNKNIAAVLGLTLLEAAIAPIVCAAVFILIHLVLGLRAFAFAKHGWGVVSGISCVSCYAAFSFKSERVMAFYSSHGKWVNFCAFSAVTTVAGFGFYFLDYLIVSFFNNSADAAGVLTTFHAQMTFHVLAVNSAFADGNIIKGGAWVQALLWYIISWLLVAVFGDQFAGASFVEQREANKVFIATSFTCTVTMVCLSVHGIMREVRFPAGNVIDSFAQKLSVYGIVALVEFVSFFTIARALAPTRPMFEVALFFQNLIPYTWVAQIIVGRHISPVLATSLLQKAECNSGLRKGVYVTACFSLSMILVVAHFFAYQKLIFPYVVVRLFQQNDPGLIARNDFGFGFAVGNQLLNWAAIETVSKKQDVRESHGPSTVAMRTFIVEGEITQIDLASSISEACATEQDLISK